MAALHSSSSFKSLEGLISCKHQPDMSNKSPRLSTLRQAHNSCCLSWSARSVSVSDSCNIGAGIKVNAVRGAAASLVEVDMESEMGISYEKLRELLAAGEWDLADEETRRLIIVLAGENAVKRKYVYFSEVPFMPKADLATIDGLWRAYSDGKFGYSVQRKIMKRVDGDCTEFFKKVGWMKALGSESNQFTYRSFPSEFVWELGASTPEGHLPLTNALRGTQLLKCLLDHPAFEFADDDLQVLSAYPSSGTLSRSLPSSTSSQLQKKPLSIYYSF